MILEIVSGWEFPRVAFQLSWRVVTKIIIIKLTFSSEKPHRIQKSMEWIYRHINQRSTSRIAEWGHPKFHFSTKINENSDKNCQPIFSELYKIKSCNNPRSIFLKITTSQQWALWHCNFPIREYNKLLYTNKLDNRGEKGKVLER